MNTDIIIPIYNAYDDLQVCLESVYKHTNLQKNRLILINDNSPDERIGSYLDKQAGENIIIIHNSSNMGFSNNINLGMAQSEQNDVILLNSDTVVTANWVEKITACAYSSPSIGTVTPISNNATLCSVPNFCEENTLPEGMSIDQAASIVETCSMKKYPRITVAHGFCMFIKREVIQNIGNFDAKTFGRGYGEENDFCNRAEQMGYIHVMCDDTYIYHSGTKSFVSDEKAAYIKAHEIVLEKRYPEQTHNNAVHCRDNPNGWVGRNIAFYFDIWNGKKNIFYLLQSDFREGAEDNIGGTQLHVKHLALGLREQMNIFVAARDREYLQITAYTKNNEHIFRFPIGTRELFPTVQGRRLAEVFQLVLKGFRIDLVHVHHTASTSLDIYYEAKKLGIPVIYTAHDFYYVCPNEKLLNVEGKICIGLEKMNCAECLNKKKGLYEKNNFLRMWRKQHLKILSLCCQIIVPSESAKEIFALYYPECRKKIKVIEHGVDMPALLHIDKENVTYADDLIWKIERFDQEEVYPFVVGTAYLSKEPDARHKVILRMTDRAGKSVYLPTNFGNRQDVLASENRFYAYIPDNLLADGDVRVSVLLLVNGMYYQSKDENVLKGVCFGKKPNFKVAFIGGINEEKGGKIITEVVSRGPKDVLWYVMGGIGDEKLFRLRKENLIKTGYYYQEDLASHLKYHGINAVCILSKWPETFSYTLSEAILNQLPVIVTDIGALGERVRKERYGLTVSADSEKAAREVITVINNWKTRSEQYAQICHTVSQCCHKGIAQMLQEYRYIYQQNMIDSKDILNCNDSSDRVKIYQAYIADKDWIENSGSENEKLVSRIRELEERIRSIDNNVTIRFMLKITERQFPFKQKIREFLQRHI